MERGTSGAPKFWIVIQPTIIRLYKVAGLVALTAILIGLVSFLTVNIFYFFDHTWVRPVVLSPTHQKVVEASTQLADAKLRASQLDTERLEIEAQLAEIDRTVKADDAFLGEAGSGGAGSASASPSDPKAPMTEVQWLVHREREKAQLDKDNADGKRAPLRKRLDALALRQKDQDAVVQRLESAPYLRAVNGKVVLAFVPYQNSRNVKIGTKLYSCAWGLVGCSVVGTVKATIDGEVQDIHPHDESVQRGFMVEVDLTTPSAEGESVLFAGSRPLMLF